MSSDDKPFACTATGCTQRFTNEDHLTVHKQKHEMTLKFGPPKFGDGTLPVADQTPTPTRFLRNCEEVGLFQELPNVNPFEHEFKKASEKQFADKEALESGIVSASTLVIKIPTVESPLSSTVETMATDSVGSTSNNTMSSPDTVSTTTNEDEVAAVHSTMQEPVTVATPISISSITTQAPSQLFAQVHHGSNPSSVPIVLRLPNGSTLPCTLPASITNPNVPFPTAISAVSLTTQQALVNQQHQQQQQQQQQQPSEAKMKLKAALIQGNMNVMSQAVEVVTRQQEQQEQQQQQMLQAEPQRARRRRNTDDDPDERRRKFLERNRAAATRCRNKKKSWITELEKKAENLTQTNNQLQNEVSLLRNEVAQLKQLLLAHKDCPITALQHKPQRIISGHMNIHENSKPTSHQITSVSAAEAVATSALTSMAHIATELQTSQSSVSSN